MISGDKEAVERAVAACKEAGAKRAMLLPVSGPFHSALMLPAADNFAEYLSGFNVQNATLPVLQNATNTFEQDAQVIRANLVKQIASPVRWTQAVELLADNGVENLLEIGPGKVLTGLNKRIAKQLNNQTINSVESLQAL